MSGGAWGCRRCTARWKDHPAWAVDCPFGGCDAEVGEPCDTTRPSLAHAARQRASEVGDCAGGYGGGALHALRPLPDQREAFGG